MEVEGFKVLRKAATTDEKREAWLLFLMQSLKIHDDEVREGPDFFFEGDSEVFIRKNSKKSKIMWVDSSKKIHSLQKRQHNDAKKFLQDLLKNHLNKSGVPKGLKTDIKKGFNIVLADKSMANPLKRHS